MAEEPKTMQVIGVLIEEKENNKAHYFIDWQLVPEIMEREETQCKLSDVLHILARGMDRKIGARWLRGKTEG
jgi:hypothetical protein